jgi:carboxymethylenebutenolidase
MPTLEKHLLNTLDGRQIQAWVARPEGQFATRPRGAVIVVQEIFGVNEHIRWVLQEQYAAAGYLAIAPCFFDRVESNVELAYSPETALKGRALVDQLGMDAPLRDIRAAQRALAKDDEGRALPCGVVGYCWGGSVAYLAATRLGLPAVSFYGGRTVPYLHERTQAPVMFHFGELDPMITSDMVGQIKEANFGAPLFVYPAGHGFNRSAHPDFHVDASGLALQRSLEFFAKHLNPSLPATLRSHKDLVDQASSKIKTVSIEQAQALHGRDDVVFVDLRDPRELSRDGTIPGAMHAPRGMLEFWVDPSSPYYKPEFSPDKTFLFFCAAAWRSALATATVQDMGVLPKIAHIDGGFGAWKKAGFPVETKESKAK